MPSRRVQLQLPDKPSDGVLRLAQTIKSLLAPQYNVKLRSVDEGDEDLTPVDFKPNEPLLVIQLGEVESDAAT